VSRSELSVLVEGRPAPQGSKTPTRGGGFREASKYLPAWRAAVELAVKQEFNNSQDARPFTVPVEIDVTFYIQRPAKPKFAYPATPPDVDKLLRGVFDALTRSGAWEDDALAVKGSFNCLWTGVDSHPVPGAFICIKKR